MLISFKQKKKKKSKGIRFVITYHPLLSSNGLVVKVLNPGVPYSKPVGGFKVDSTLYPSEVDKMRTRNFWELGGKVNCLLEVALA